MTSSGVVGGHRSAAALLFAATAIGCARSPTRLADLDVPALTASYATTIRIPLTGELGGAAAVQLSFPEVGQRLRDACPRLAVTVSVNHVTLPVTDTGGPTTGSQSEGGDSSGFCRPFQATGEIGVLDGPFLVVIRDDSATFVMRSSNLIQSTRFGLTEPERASAAEPWSVVLSAGAPVHLFNPMDTAAERDDPDPAVPRLTLQWNIARDWPVGIQIDPRHVRIPLPAASGTPMPEITPSLTQERPSIEECDGPASCAGSGTADARPFWFWFEYPAP